MFQDRTFQQLLRNNEIIKKDAPIFNEWQKKRRLFEQRLDHVMSNKYGYVPAKKNLVGLFTSMFLHGSFMHLLGNMVFLWFVGSFLEAGVKSVVYFSTYHVAGVCAALLFGIVNSHSYTPLIGASGAIAGLMGAYGIVYGRARIKVFYSLGFYFDYARFPGWILFPFWLGKEIYQLNAGTFSNVAYLAHIGGLLAGAIGGGFHRYTNKDIDEEVALDKEEKERAIQELLDSGLNKLAKFDHKGARRDIEKVLELKPTSRIAMVNLFNIDKCDPQSELFHQSAKQLLHEFGQDESAGHDFLIFYDEYRKLSSQPRLSVDLLVMVIDAYLQESRLKDAEQILALIMKKTPKYKKIPDCLLKLGRSYISQSNQKEGLKCMKILVGNYSDSIEAEKAKELLKRSTMEVN